MIQESAREPLLLPPDEDGEATQPRIAAQKPLLEQARKVLQLRRNGRLTVSIDEHGTVTLLAPGQTPLVLGPEGAFDLLDFLFEFRDLLAARSAEVAERLTETRKERD